MKNNNKRVMKFPNSKNKTEGKVGEILNFVGRV